MFILGIYRGNIFPKSLIFPQKTFVSGKGQLFVQRKAFCFWKILPPDPLNRALPLDSAGGTAPRPPAVVSIYWCPRCPDTPSFWPCSVKIIENIMCKCANSFSFWGTSYPRPSELAHGLQWRTSEVPIPSSPACIKWQTDNESLCFSLRLCFSNAVLMVGWHWQKFWSRFAFTDNDNDNDNRYLYSAPYKIGQRRWTRKKLINSE